MRRRIARMVRRRDDGPDLGVELERAGRPVGVFRVPTGDADIEQRHERQGESAGGAWRAGVEPALQALLAELLVPILVSAQAADLVLPERGFVVGDRRAREVLDLVQLGLLFR